MSFDIKLKDREIKARPFSEFEPKELIRANEHIHMKLESGEAVDLHTAEIRMIEADELVEPVDSVFIGKM